MDADKLNEERSEEVSNKQNENIDTSEINIIEVMKSIENDLQDPKYQTFSKTKYWHNNNEYIEEYENVLKEIQEKLQIIENKLGIIEDILRK
ncbi:MAG: hypothetical protein PHV71_01240 [Eubacteriales bacterium]|nr:hypothetical protein [Eubacteriales bacterium]MDD4629209.1 hypothetical protein [Eubacteriales bacterium]